MPDDPTLLDSPADPSPVRPGPAAEPPSDAGLADPAAPAGPASSPRASQWETLEHMEHLLAEIRGALDAAARDAEHRAFSIAATVGAILEVVVGGLVVLALADWALGTATQSILLKLSFAAVFQLAALTAFVVARRA